MPSRRASIRTRKMPVNYTHTDTDSDLDTDHENLAINEEQRVERVQEESRDEIMDEAPFELKGEQGEAPENWIHGCKYPLIHMKPHR